MAYKSVYSINMNQVCYSIILNIVGNDFKSFLFTFMHIITELKPDAKENSDKLNHNVKQVAH